MQIRGSTIVISGASSGLGAALGRELARRGAHVILLARTGSALEALSHEITAAGGKASWYAVDLTDAEAVAAIVQQLRAEHGAPHGLINNAGLGRFLALEETTPTEALAMMQAPYFAAVYLTQALLPSLLSQPSLIVNVTSPAALMPWAGATTYAAARAAMLGFTNALRLDLHRSPVRVMLAMPGKFTSAYFDNNPGSEERLPSVAKLIPTWSPERVAVAVADGIERGRRAVIVPWQLRAFLWMNRIWPAPIEWLILRTGWNRDRMNKGTRGH